MVKIRQVLGVIGFFLFLGGGLIFFPSLLSGDETGGVIGGIVAFVGFVMVLLAGLLKELD